ncbi:MAG: response regulator transcription factor [Candidatus Latescibacteria bacterium]|jgi:DNA-binding response OmpR family regulator|nr:response regulator transcription factor [Candidatus Latescibacterota bacterium]
MHHVLIVSSQAEARDDMAQDVASFGYQTTTADEMSRAIGLMESDPPDVVLLDLLDRMLGADASWREALRQLPRGVPVIVLIPEEGLKGFDFPSSVVDFLLVPFGPLELNARLGLALGVASVRGASDVVRRGPLEIDLDRYQVSLDGAVLELTLKEYELLKFLVEHPGKVHTRESLMIQVWGYDYFGGTRTVDVHVRRIRSKLEPLADNYVETVRGVGYRFRD